MTALAVAAATVAAFLVSGAYYGLLAPAPAGVAPERPAAATAAVELIRSAAVVGLLAGLLAALDVREPVGGAVLGLALWVLPVVLLAGSVFHEGTRVRTAVLHAGDWLIKLVVIGVVLGLFL